MKKEKGSANTFQPEESVIPTDNRIRFDTAVCKALGIEVSKGELCNLYKAIVNEMIITRGLTKY